MDVDVPIGFGFTERVCTGCELSWRPCVRHTPSAPTAGLVQLLPMTLPRQPAVDSTTEHIAWTAAYVLRNYG